MTKKYNKDKKRELNKERINNAFDKIIDYFQSGQFPQAVARTVLQQQAGMEIPSLNWSLGNQVIMLASGTSDARGFKQWQKIGRYPKKGAKAIYILGPIYKNIKKEDNSENEKEENKLYDSEEEKSRTKTVIVGFTGVPVFRYEDTDGEPIEYPDYNPPEPPPLIEVAKKYDVDVTYCPGPGNILGSYQRTTSNIVLRSHDVDVFFHELAHAVHNSFRPLRGGQDAKQEIVAETVSAVLCELYGYTGYINHSYQYINYYANMIDRDKPNKAAKEVMNLAADIKKVLELILDYKEVENKRSIAS